MRTLALLLAACSQLLAVTCPSGYGFYAQLPIDATKVGTADSTNFPVYIQGNAELKVTGSGGHVQNSSGFDIVYGDCSTASLYKFERVFWVGTNGANSEFWIKVPTVSHSTNTNFCVFYGNAAITTDQQDAVNTWDSSYVLINHWPDGTTLSNADSTGLNTMTSHATPTAVAGQVDGGLGLATASVQYVDAGSNARLNPTAITYETWINATTLGHTANMVMSKVVVGGSAAVQLSVSNTGKVSLFATTGGTVSGTGTATITTGTWFHLALTYDSTVGLNGYVNGALDKNVAASGNLNTTAAVFTIGQDTNTSGRSWNGPMDESRVSNIARPVNWILASYNNQNSPSTFLTGASWGNACTAPTSSPSLPLRGVGE